MVEAFAHHREGEKRDLTWSLFFQVYSRQVRRGWLEAQGTER